MSTSYDPDHTYSVPYFYGTLGLLYNTTEVDESVVSSWDCLWDPTYEDEIIMENSVRDTFAPALIDLGYSLNETDESNLREALEVLKQQKKDKIVYAYYVDETADAMISEEANIALCYSGEAALAMDENENLAYSVPQEGSNLWIDSWFIPKSCTNQDGALQFLDFLCRDDIAALNYEYVEYGSPITSVVEDQDEETRNNEAINPSSETLQRCEIYTALDDEKSQLYTTLWQELLSY
jgi:spermidine/putrescine-binding protein